MMLGYIHNGTVRAEFMSSVLSLYVSPQMRFIGRMASQPAASLVSYGRNMLVLQFLESDQQWLWMVDTDMTFTPVDLARLIGSADVVERPVVTGVCAIFDANTSMVNTAVFTASRASDGGVAKFHPFEELPKSGLVRVDGCGAAFLMIHRSVLEKIPLHDWFRESVAEGGGIRGEDLSFCDRVGRAGFPIWADCSVRPGHMKTVCLSV